jgi:NADPH:quinone reductase-like Zn-dependent oxidoreductase
MRVHASSLNARDLFMLDGRALVPPGRVPLSDAAGVIEAVGPGATRFQVGDRVVNSFNRSLAASTSGRCIICVRVERRRQPLGAVHRGW